MKKISLKYVDYIGRNKKSNGTSSILPRKNVLESLRFFLIHDLARQEESLWAVDDKYTTTIILQPLIYIFGKEINCPKGG